MNTDPMPSPSKGQCINEAAWPWRWLFLNLNLHLVHHDLPGLAWYDLLPRLPRASPAMAGAQRRVPGAGIWPVMASARGKGHR